MDKELEELEYSDLKVDIFYGDIDKETNYPEREFESEIEFTYKVPKEDVKYALGEIIGKNHIEEIPTTDVDSDAIEEIIPEYVEEHYEELFKKYHNEVLDYFREDASLKANETLDVENFYPDDNDSDYFYDDID